MKKRITCGVTTSNIKAKLTKDIQNGASLYDLNCYLNRLQWLRQLSDSRRAELQDWLKDVYNDYLRSTNEGKIADFIGKDIWVRCRERNHYNDEVYVRFYSIDKNGIIECSILDDMTIETLPEKHEWYRNKLMTDVTYTGFDEIEVVEPLVTLTSKDIDPDYSDDIEELLSYAGTDYWIKVTFSESYYDFEDYIKILSVDGYEIEYQSIRADVLKGEIYEKYDWESAIEDIDDVETVNVYKVRICKPLDVLTDEEIQDEIARIDAEVAEWEDEW